MRSLFFVSSALLHAGLAFAVIKGASTSSQEAVEVVMMEVKGSDGDLSVESLKRQTQVLQPKAIKKQSKTLPRPVVQDQAVQAKAEAVEAAAEPATTESAVADNEGSQFGSENGAEVSAQERYLAELRSMLERRKEYPLLAKRLRQQGKVIVKFILARDGRVMRAEVIENSQFESLNKAAEKLITSINGLKPFPAEVKKAEWTFVLPVEFRM